MIYGVGIIDGKDIGHAVNSTRNRYLKGDLIFAPEFNTAFHFTAASGLPGRYFSVPFGTYTLTPQSVGWIIENLYRRYNIDNHPGFDTVWNVGTPEDETCTGTDPALGRSRREIQMHCEPRLVSEGCIVLGATDFHMFADTMKALGKIHKLALVVSPTAPTFRIIPQ